MAVSLIMVLVIGCTLILSVATMILRSFREYRVSKYALFQIEVDPHLIFEFEFEFEFDFQFDSDFQFDFHSKSEKHKYFKN